MQIIFSLNDCLLLNTSALPVKANVTGLSVNLAYNIAHTENLGLPII